MARVDGANIPDDVLREVEDHDAQVIVERDGKPVAVLVSSRFMAVFRELAEELENRLDLKDYREAKKNLVESGEEPEDYDQFRKELDR